MSPGPSARSWTGPGPWSGRGRAARGGSGLALPLGRGRPALGPGRPGDLATWTGRAGPGGPAGGPGRPPHVRPGRRPLRSGQRLPEEPAGLRPGRGPVLPVPHDPWRGGSALHRPGAWWCAPPRTWATPIPRPSCWPRPPAAPRSRSAGRRPGSPWPRPSSTWPTRPRATPPSGHRRRPGRPGRAHPRQPGRTPTRHQPRRGQRARAISIPTLDYARPQAFLPVALRAEAFYQPIRPQERNWKDRAGAGCRGPGRALERWTRPAPRRGRTAGGRLGRALGCSREALARALVKLAGGAWRVERRLVAEPNR